MKTTFIIFAIMLFAFGIVLVLLKEMKMLKNTYESNQKTIDKLIKTNQELINLVDTCQLERGDLVEALEYANHFLKPRKRLCMWQIAGKHIKK